jgi:hypothetical protein
MLIIFFDIKGIVPKEFILAGQTANSTYCCNVLWSHLKMAETLGTRGRPKVFGQRAAPVPGIMDGSLYILRL